MPHLSLSLLGSFYPTIDGQPVTGFSSAKVRGLLAYLAVNCDRPIGREALAGLFWPDEPHDVAHVNLRQAIANLRQVLGDRASAAPFLVVSRDTVQYRPDGDSSIDVAAFRELLAACQSHAHRHPDACGTCARRLQQAADLYRGDFLADLFVDDSVPYEEWALLQREELHRAALGALHRLADCYALRGDYENARRYAGRQLELDPWREEAHRQLMQALALDGRRSEALAQYERCRRTLREEFQAEPAAETTNLVRQIRAGTLTPAAVEPTKHNWPAPLTSFIGRQREQAQLVERLQMPATRLVTIVGLGGAGKTRLATCVGEQLAAEFRDGALFVSLAGVSGAAFVSHAIAAALGLVLSNRADPTSELAASLRKRDLLLVLDNCEHEAGLAEVLGLLLRTCPKLVALATAQAPLMLDGEWIFRLEGLSTASSIASAGSLDSDAAQLFLDRMRQASGEQELTETTGHDIARICELVEGLPLAIEVAAGWTSVKLVREIAADIERDLSLVAQDRAPAGSRPGVDAILRRSWALLPPNAQHVLRQLAVFHGGFRPDEAARVLQLPDAGASIPVVDGRRNQPASLDAVLSLLVDRSLLRRSGKGRYRQHPLVKQFANQRLAEMPELKDAVEARHMAAYATLLADAAIPLKSASQQAALADLDDESRNLQAAWRCAVRRRDYHVIGQCVDALDSYFDLHSWSEEAVLEFSDAVELLSTPEPDGQVERATLGGLMARLGMHCYRLDRLEVAREVLDDSLKVLEIAGAGRQRALAFHALGSILFWQGEYARAEWCFALGLELVGPAGDEWRAASLTYLLGDCASIAGDHERAMSDYRKSLDVFRRLGDPRMISVGLSNLADGLRRQQHSAEARPLYLESLQIAEKIGHRRLVGNNLNGLGELAYDLDDYGAARQYYQASLDVCREIGARLLASLDMTGLAYTACREGDTAGARAYLRRVMEDLLANRSWAVLPAVLIGVAHVLVRQGDAGMARAAALLGRVLCYHVTWDEYRYRARRLLSEIEAVLGRDAYNQALAGAAPLRVLIRETLELDIPEETLSMADEWCRDAAAVRS